LISVQDEPKPAMWNSLQALHCSGLRGRKAVERAAAPLGKLQNNSFLKRLLKEAKGLADAIPKYHCESDGNLGAHKASKAKHSCSAHFLFYHFPFYFLFFLSCLLYHFPFLLFMRPAKLAFFICGEK